jgi:hydrazine synthase alpha subunit-like protein
MCDLRQALMRPSHLAFLAAIILAIVASPVLAQKSVEQTWNEEHAELLEQISRAKEADTKWRNRLAAEALDQQALVLPADKDPLDVVLRRTTALVDHFKDRQMLAESALSRFESQLQGLRTAAHSATEPDARKRLFHQVCDLRRRVAFANPLLDFERVVCMLEQPGFSRMMEQARAVFPGHSTGGGPILVENFKSEAVCSQLLAGVKVASGPWKGKELSGKFSGLELNYDGKELLFAATTDVEAWHVFRFNLETRQLEQLTDGLHDDFDPHQLPSGRIVFTSTRRGGIGRCGLVPESLTYTLYSMEPDGSDMVCLSFHEGNEWAPTVSNSGKIVYTRWDYVDRHWGTAHHFWECFPDGRDPRSFHGNYPLPHSAMPDGISPADYGRPSLVFGRLLRPDGEQAYRPIPNSPKYTATAVGHHTGFSGSLVLLDPRIADDGKMSQLKRITPEYFFPEVEQGLTTIFKDSWQHIQRIMPDDYAYPETDRPHAKHTYGTAWPLSEDFYLCNYDFGLYLLDRFGNRDVIYDPGPGPFRVRAPFPLRSRPMPPELAVKTWQGKRAGAPDHRRAVISVMNVYESDEVGRLPEGIEVKWMRIVQVIPHLRTDPIDVTLISLANDSIGRMPLGVVPVEPDGSVYCEAPVGKTIYFQLLDEKGMAVQSMRSATYVHPGEHLSCVGCHEDKQKRIARSDVQPLALQRPPSKLVPEVESGAVPFNYIQLVKAPVFDKKCVPCHQENPKAPDMSYASLARHDRMFASPGEGLALATLGIGGSRTTPGKFGAHASGIIKALSKPQHKDLELTADELRRITLWLDLNSNEIGWAGNDPDPIAAQKQGLALWPPVDVDPANPTGVETDLPLGGR